MVRRSPSASNKAKQMERYLLFSNPSILFVLFHFPLPFPFPLFSTNVVLLQELLLSSFGVQTPRELTTSAMQQVPVRVVLPGVSHAHMSCMVAQHECDATTTPRDIINALLKENEGSMGINAAGDKALYGIYVVPGSKAYVSFFIAFISKKKEGKKKRGRTN